jgi:hypothetical protein
LPARRRSAALPAHELRSAISPRTQAATGCEERLESAAEAATAPREETDNQDEATTVENT